MIKESFPRLNFLGVSRDDVKKKNLNVKKFPTKGPIQATI